MEYRHIEMNGNIQHFPSTTIKQRGVRDTTVKVACIVGTRPEIVKSYRYIADLKQIYKYSQTTQIVAIYTGQQPDLAPTLMDAVGLSPDVHLPFLDRGLSLEKGLAELLTSISGALEEIEPDIVCVQGDTTSSFAGALAARMKRLHIIHVEAGVRSGNIDEPFPEEQFRRSISHISNSHIAFDQSAVDVLMREGISEKQIRIAEHPARKYIAHILDGKNPQDRTDIVITLHRRERRDERQRLLIRLVARIRARYPRLVIVLISHPGVNWTGYTEALKRLRISLVNDMTPTEFLGKLSSASLLITDSAGASEEAAILNISTLVFRDVHENRAEDATLHRRNGTDLTELWPWVKTELSSQKDFSSRTEPLPPQPQIARAIQEIVDGLQA